MIKVWSGGLGSSSIKDQKRKLFDQKIKTKNQNVLESNP